MADEHEVAAERARGDADAARALLERLFALIRRTDRGLVWLNILYLLPLCLLPFGAGLLGRYDQEPVALRIYGLQRERS
jgi:hypothetical protein